ncbi:MAG: hypothetical protein ABW321_12085 [Polyangiales bacterium]
MVTWAAPSTAEAQGQEYCLVDGDNPAPGDTIYCVHEEIGLLASLTVVATNGGNSGYSIALRQLEGYWCEALAYNDFGSAIGYAGPFTYRDQVVEGCFSDGSGQCYDISPVALVRLICHQG